MFFWLRCEVWSSVTIYFGPRDVLCRGNEIHVFKSWPRHVQNVSAYLFPDLVIYYVVRTRYTHLSRGHDMSDMYVYLCRGHVMFCSGKRQFIILPLQRHYRLIYGPFLFLFYLRFPFLLVCPETTVSVYS